MHSEDSSHNCVHTSRLGTRPGEVIAVLALGSHPLSVVLTVVVARVVVLVGGAAVVAGGGAWVVAGGGAWVVAGGGAWVVAGGALG